MVSPSMLTSITARTVNQKTTPLGIPNRFNQSEIDSRPCSILIESKLGPSLLIYRDFRAVKCSISLEITLTYFFSQHRKFQLLCFGHTKTLITMRKWPPLICQDIAAPLIISDQIAALADDRHFHHAGLPVCRNILFRFTD